MTEKQIYLLAAIGVALWAAILLLQGQPLSLHSLTPFSYVVSGLTVAVVVWEKWLWSWQISQVLLIKRPDLRGTWKGTLVSDWPDRKGIPTQVFLVIRQTASKIEVRLFSAESDSNSLSGNIVKDGADGFKLAMIYRNTPRLLKREGSPVHHGGMLLTVIGNPAQRLDGEYWTDRNTKGEATCTARTNRVAQDFNEASLLKF